MKSFLSLIVMLFIMFSNVHGIKFIKNPEQPMKKDSGKTLQLKEVLSIHDSEGSYYFKYPYKFKISSKDDIFMCDEKQLLKFDSKGKFIRNFFKEGQGPQEVTFVKSYLLENEMLIIYDSGQNKVVIFNHETGEYKREFRLPADTVFTSSELFYRFDGRLFFHRRETVESKGKIELIDLDEQFISLSPDGKQYKKNIGFPRKVLNGRIGENSLSIKISEFLLCPAPGDLLYVSHTPEYNIKLYSFKTDSILCQFSRKYNRVEVTEKYKKYAPGGNFSKISMGNGEWYTPEIPKYHPDIQTLFFVKGRLWVITSTIKNSEKILVDVFDRNGVYEENFFIDFPQNKIPYQIRKWIAEIKDDFLYAVEEDEDGSPLLKKYKIDGWL